MARTIFNGATCGNGETDQNHLTESSQGAGADKRGEIMGYNGGMIILLRKLGVLGEIWRKYIKNMNRRRKIGKINSLIN
jgi:hypothetical protein